MRIGSGYDVHRLSLNLPLIIGGVRIDAPFGTEAHSDGDVLLHALIDAMFGALAIGDIGQHFPNTDPKYRGISSVQLLRDTMEICGPVKIVNIDSTLFLQQPKLAPYIPVIRQNIAAVLGIDIGKVSVKAKTAEQLGPVGDSEAVAASVTILID